MLQDEGIGRADTGQTRKATEFYVSPDGNDAWSGSLPAPNSARTDGPLATVARARNKVRDASRTRKPDEVFRVVLRGGFYTLPETLVFTAEDSGTEAAPITYAAYPNETPVLSGGKQLTAWKQTAPQTYSTTVREAIDGKWPFQQLYVNTGRRYRPRLPKAGYAFIASELPPSSQEEGKGFDQFRYASGDLYTSWRNREDIEVLAFHIWTMSRFRIATLDGETRTVRFTGNTRNTQPYSKMPTGGRYLVDNVAEALSEPGEWYREPKTGTVTYIAGDNEDPTQSKTKIYVPRLEKLLDIREAAHLSFQGITFAHAAWYITPEGNSFPQAEIPVPAALTVTNSHHIHFQSCTVRNIGNYAMHFAGTSAHCAVQGCELRDLGAGGIKIGEMTNNADPEKLVHHITVQDCLLAEGGRIHPAAVGIWVGHSHHNILDHNEIVDFYYTGISLGWSWGYGPSGCHNNQVTWNHIHNIGQGVLSDMGGIYTLGLSPGSVLQHNLIHDIAAIQYGGWGIYFDEGTTGMVAEDNIVYNTKSAPFHQHYGRENIVRNNILAFGQEAQLMRTRAEDHLSFTLERNIVYYKEGPLLGSNWTGKNFALNHNLYWNSAGQAVTFAGKTLQAWQAEGFDAGSLVQDPLFTNPAKGDFTLKQSSPATQLGFKPIDLSSAGRTSGKPYAGKVAMSFPPPPPPRPIADGFEDTPVGLPPGIGTVHEEAAIPAATIHVTNETAATGKQSLKFTDAPGLKARYNPHLHYSPKLDTGKVVGIFALRIESGAVFFHEWRDAGSPYQVGPSLRVEGGNLLAGGRTLTNLQTGLWYRFEITCELGAKATGTWHLRLHPAEGKTQEFANLPCGSGQNFRQIRWWGFVSDADTNTAFYLDDISLK